MNYKIIKKQRYGGNVRYEIKLSTFSNYMPQVLSYSSNALRTPIF